MITKGQKINDRYEIIRSIGEGGMANVYLGYDTILDRNVAIKVLRGDLSNDEKFVRRFQREALSASSLAHPNIVEMYDVGEDDGTYYIVMEYVDGKTLKQLLKKRGSLTISEALDIMCQLTDGMAHAHDSYIIHRDLKPQNIMIKDDGQIKITDFGIAMALNATQLTQTNSVMGSVHYLPPEQASGKGCTIKSDIYSMGIIFYELLSGSLPFRGDNAVEIALKHMREPLPSLRESNPAIPQSIENIIKRATAKNAKNRYDSAREMHEDLLTALDDDRMNEEEYQYKYPEHENEKKAKSEKTTNPKLKESDEENEDKKEEEIVEDIVDKKEEKEEKDSGEEELSEKEKKSQKIFIIVISILSGIFVLIFLVVMFIFFVLPSLSSTKSSVIPDCEGKKVSACEKALLDAGFEVSSKIETEESTLVKKNLVIRTDPEAGRHVKQGTTVKIYKSLGENLVTIDNYVGQKVDDVKKKLEKDGIVVTVQKKEPEDQSRKYPDDEIIDQSLGKGNELKKGDSIILYVASNETKFPDFVAEGYSLDDVKAFCDENALVCTYNEDETDSVQEGRITYQSRKADTVVAQGSNLTVKYAVKPKAKPQPTPTPTPSQQETDSGEEKTE